MPMVVPLIAYGMIAGFTTGLVMTIATTSISYLTQRHARKKAERQARDAWNASVQDRNILIRSSVSPRKIIYGEVATAGTLVYVQSTGALNEVLTTVTVVAGHEIDGYSNIYLDKEDVFPLEVGGAAKAGGRYNQTLSSQQAIASIVPSGGTATLPVTPASIQGISTRIDDNADFGPGISVSFTWSSGTSITDIPGAYNGQTLFVTYTPASAQVPYVWVLPMLGAPGQVAWDWLVSNSAGKWTSNHRGDGVAYVGINYAYGDAVFPNGAPPVRYVVRGMKCYDPRTTTTAWTKNPALIIRNYLLSNIGFRLTVDEIDDAAIIAAANICDEQVQINLAGTIFQARYQCNTELSMENNRWDNLQILLSSMAGEVTYSQGKWIVFAGAYTTPVMSLNEDDVCGDEIQIVSRTARADLFNEVRGVYIDPTKDWQLTDFPPIRNSFYEDDDGGERLPNEIVLPATTDGLMAQRVAKIFLEDARQALSVRAPFKWKAYPLQPGDNITLTIARYGFSSKVFKVVEREFDPTVGILLTLKEEHSSVYEWNFGNVTVVDPAPNSNLPSPYDVPAIAGVLLFSGNTALQKLADGTIVSRIRVEWDAITDPAVVNGGHIEIAYRDAGEEVWHAIPLVFGNDVVAYIQPVLDGGTYYVRIRAVNGIGAKGHWQYYSTVVIGKTALPPNLTGFTVAILPDGSRRFTVTAPVGVADGSVIHIKYVTGSSSTWSAMSDLRTIVYDQTIGTYMFELSEPPAGTWSFGARLFDTTGNAANGLFIVGAALTQHPVFGAPSVFSATMNLLLNADFTHNLSDYGSQAFADGRSLNHWVVNQGPPDGGDAVWGRNYSEGLWYNIGSGGAYGFNVDETQDWSFISQRVPITAGIDYECSVYASAENCGVQLYLRWLNGGLGILGDAQGAPDEEVVSGAGTFGHPTNPFLAVRLFRYGVAPAGAAYADIYLLKLGSNSGTVTSTAWFHMVMLANRTADAVSRATASPWVPSHGVDYDEVGTPGIYPGAATDVIESKPADSSYDFSGVATFNHTIGTVSWENTTGAPVIVAGHCSVTARFNDANGFTDVNPFVRFRVTLDGSVIRGGAGNQGQQLAGTNYTNVYWNFADNFSVVVPDGQTISAALRFDGERLFGNFLNNSVNWLGAAVQIQGIKR